jgi:hypothetical protein
MDPRISSKTHAVVDYLTIGTLLTLPRVLGFSQKLTDAITTLALGQLGYTLMTRHEGGVVRVLPFKAHLVMDAVGGAGLATLPWTLGEDDDDTAKVTCAAMGAFEVMAAAMTEPRSQVEQGGWEPDERRQRRPAVSRRQRDRQPAIASPA